MKLLQVNINGIVILSLQTPFQVHGFSVTGQILTAEVRSSLNLMCGLDTPC